MTLLYGKAFAVKANRSLKYLNMVLLSILNILIDVIY